MSFNNQRDLLMGQPQVQQQQQLQPLEDPFDESLWWEDDHLLEGFLEPSYASVSVGSSNSSTNSSTSTSGDASAAQWKRSVAGHEELPFHQFPQAIKDQPQPLPPQQHNHHQVQMNLHHANQMEMVANQNVNLTLLLPWQQGAAAANHQQQKTIGTAVRRTEQAPHVLQMAFATTGRLMKQTMNHGSTFAAAPAAPAPAPAAGTTNGLPPSLPLLQQKRQKQSPPPPPSRDADADASTTTKNAAPFPPTKDPKSAMLHRCCQQFPRELYLIQAALRQDPMAAGRRYSMQKAVQVVSSTSSSITNKKTTATTTTTSDSSRCIPIRPLISPSSATTTSTISKKKQQKTEPYTIPINIALYHHATIEVLDVLLEATPAHLLSFQEGPECDTCTLQLALRQYNYYQHRTSTNNQDANNSSLSFLIRLLSKQTMAAYQKDRRGNTPLHVACTKLTTTAAAAAAAETQKQQQQCPSYQDFLMILYKTCPQAAAMTNMHGETPLSIVQRYASQNCEEIVNFLQAVGY